MTEGKEGLFSRILKKKDKFVHAVKSAKQERDEKMKFQLTKIRDFLIITQASMNMPVDERRIDFRDRAFMVFSLLPFGVTTIDFGDDIRFCRPNSDPTEEVIWTLKQIDDYGKVNATRLGESWKPIIK